MFKLNEILNCNNLNLKIIFIFCIIGHVENLKIYNFIHDEIPFFLKSDICTTDICKKDAQRILSSLNTSIDPCEDFYEYSCGGWFAKNKRPSSEPVWGQWEPVMRKIQKNIEEILENQSNNDFRPINLAREMYKACIDQDQNQDKKTDSESKVILNKLLKNLGGWPILEKKWKPNEFWAITTAKINSFLNVHPFLNFHVSIDLYNSSQHALYIDHPSFLFPKNILSDPPSYERHLKAYDLFIMDSALELMNDTENSVDIKTIKKFAFDVVKLETKLVDLMSSNENIDNLTEVYKKINIEHLQFLTDLIPVKNENYQVRWLDVINTLFENINVTAKSSDFVIVKDLSYVLKLIKFLPRVPPKVIANYLGWSIVKNLARDSTKNLEKFSNTMEKIINGVTDDISRKQYCISIVNKHLGLAIAHKYIDKNSNAKTKKEVEKMTENIKTVLVTKLNSLKWMDDVTKINAIDKAKEIEISVGYPEWLRNSSYLSNYYSSLQVTKYHLLNIISALEFKKGLELKKWKSSIVNERWSGMPTDVNAYYNVLQNSIILPMGILQYPFYKINRNEAVNYGSIGTIIGHEFSHAFDNTGRQVDKYGNLIQWWSKESLQKYEENIKCFQDHYHGYTVAMLEMLNSKEIPIDIKRTQDENIADLIGLDLAYLSYKNTKSYEQKLPGLENFTSDQIFFLSYATQWCEISSKEQLISDLLEGSHTPTKIRVLGALSSSETFSKVFNCPINSPMNPNEKCTIW